jgi:hypothetical protein
VTLLTEKLDAQTNNGNNGKRTRNESGGEEDWNNLVSKKPKNI